MLLELYFHQMFTIDILTLLAIKSENISSYIVSYVQMCVFTCELKKNCKKAEYL